MDGRAATSNLLNLTSFEKAVLWQSLRALSDYTISGLPPNTRKIAPSTTPTMRRSSLSECPTTGAPPTPPTRPLTDAKSTSLLRMVRTLPPVGRKHLSHPVGDRPHPDLPYPSGSDQKNDLSTARRADCSQCPSRERSRKGTVRSQYSQDWSFDDFNATKPCMAHSTSFLLTVTQR